MKIIERDYSLITKKKNLEPLFTFKNAPVYIGCTDEGPEKDLFMDMEWGICPESGLIQLKKLIPLDLLYNTQHFDGTGPTWRQYYDDFSNYIVKQNPEHILEIGGGLGILADTFIKKTDKIDWAIIEPNPTLDKKDRISVHKGFFDKNFKFNKKYDTIVHSQVIEHMYNPGEFLNNISEYLSVGGKMVFGYPNLYLYLDKKYTNALNFEHTVFLTDYLVAWYLNQNNFEIVDKTIYKEHIFCTAVKVANCEKFVLQNKYSEYKELFNNFIKYYHMTIDRLNNYLDNYNGKVFIFGAHIFSQYLFAFGLKMGKILAVLDNSKIKQNKRLYGTPLMVESPEVLRGLGQCVVILKVASYRNEIVDQIAEINPSAIILE